MIEQEGINDCAKKVSIYINLYLSAWSSSNVNCGFAQILRRCSRRFSTSLCRYCSLITSVILSVVLVIYKSLKFREVSRFG